MAGSGSGTRSPQLRTGQGLHVLQHARSAGPASGVLGPHVVQVIWVQQSSQRAHKARPDASPGCGGAAAAAATHLPAKSPGLRPIAPPCPWRTALHTGRRRPACGGFAGAGRRPHRQHRSWPAAAAAPGCCERCQTWWARGRPRRRCRLPPLSAFRMGSAGGGCGAEINSVCAPSVELRQIACRKGAARASSHPPPRWRRLCTHDA